MVAGRARGNRDGGARAGGFLYEKGPHGLRLDWSRVLAWEPPDSGCRLLLLHRGFGRHGEGAESYAEMM
jgi:hypothetical protein